MCKSLVAERRSQRLDFLFVIRQDGCRIELLHDVEPAQCRRITGKRGIPIEEPCRDEDVGVRDGVVIGVPVGGGLALEVILVLDRLLQRFRPGSRRYGRREPLFPDRRDRGG